MKAKHDYTALDAAIIKRISDGAKAMGDIARGDVSKHSKAMADAENAGVKYWRHQVDSWRIVDRRLQALRKAGQIAFVRGSGGGWEITKEASAS